MNWWSMIPAVLSVFGGIQGYDAGKEMESLGKEQDLMAEENAILEKRELQEQVRRQDDEDRRLRASATARGAASGADVGSGSIAGYIGYMKEEQGRQMDWLKESGASAIRLRLQGAKMEARATRMRGKAQGMSSLLGGFTDAFMFADMGGAFTKPKVT